MKKLSYPSGNPQARGPSQAEKKSITKRFEKSTSDCHDLITSLVHIEKLDCTWDDALKAFTYRSKYRLGFNDAINLAVMERNNILDIYSFDKTFDNIPWLKRKDAEDMRLISILHHLANIIPKLGQITINFSSPTII